MKVVITTKENDVEVYYCNEAMEYNGRINLYSIANGEVDVLETRAALLFERQ